MTGENTNPGPRELRANLGGAEILPATENPACQISNCRAANGCPIFAIPLADSVIAVCGECLVTIMHRAPDFLVWTVTKTGAVFKNERKEVRQ